MAETSGPWDGSTFAEDEWRELFTVLPDTHIPSGDDKIDFTLSASNREITVSAGYLLVQGMMYQNTANIVIDVPSPGGGNTRIDYIVATYDPSEVTLADRIVIELVQGTPSGGTPTAPALTQNAAGTWQMPLAVIGPYGTGVISLAPFVELGRIFTRRSFLDIGSADDPSDIEGAFAAELHDEIVDQLGRTWRYTGGGTWAQSGLGVVGAGWEDVLVEPIAPLRTIETENGTSQSAFTSTTFAGGSVNCGHSFVAPPSGIVTILVYGDIAQTVAGDTTFLSAEVRTGGTVGSGTVVAAAADAKAVTCHYEMVEVEASAHWTVTGLTPGSTYNVRTMHKVSSGGSGSAFHRRVTTLPSL